MRPNATSSVPGCLAAAVLPINGSTRNPSQIYTYDQMWSMFGSHHVGGCHFLLGDGSVRFASENMSLSVYRSLGARNDSLPLGGWE
jgi:hypothetical protein